MSDAEKFDRWGTFNRCIFRLECKNCQHSKYLNRAQKCKEKFTQILV